MSKTMNDRFDLLEASLASTQVALACLGDRIKEVENATADYDRRLSLVEQKFAKVQSENKALREKVIDLEARSRRQNIKIVGLPEKIENGRPTEFLTKFIPDLLGASNFSKPLEVDRGHRLGRQPSGEDARPRVMIARIHHFQTKEKILQLARQQFPLRYQGRPIHIFPDLPAEIMKQRQAFNDVRKHLREAGVRSGFIYPARLRVTHGTTDKVFSSPEETEVYIGTLS
ncbi:LINE-1 retrotransposable element ORF1 protein [Anabarilius grahami]|uniref:LINE-1 retrotransposable element ORF1 protein n=1 Tax=Anabarilius grahami TaxID=495550 RepID=A0A3N0YDA9_ANAGA|nr:LINE-1 retrotransposable element ORF1 protein [Anabarilius grahami]